MPVPKVQDIESRLRAGIGERLLTREPMRHHTTLRIGGPADFYVEAATPEELTGALKAAREAGVTAFLIGGGSNLLVSDDGVRGLVVRNACETVEFEGTAALVGGGVDFLSFIHTCREREIAGLEFAAGIPGSIGGAIYGNAGCYGQDIGSFVVECTVARMDGSRVETFPAPWFEFRYRESRLKRDPRVLLSALLKLRRGDGPTIQKVIDEMLEIRRVKHPHWRVEPTAGSYFKNLPPKEPGGQRVPAGVLLDQCACRGLRVGDALVFPKHANIIVNAGHATARDVLQLAEMMKARVRKRFAVELEEEVMFLGEKPPLEPVKG